MRRFAQRPVAYFGVATLTSLVLFAVGCSGSKSPSVANVPSTATTQPATSSRSAGSSSVSGSVDPQGLQFAQCMRSHGVPNWPDPVSSGGKTRFFPGPSSGIDENSPTVRAALKVCQKYIPGGSVTRAQSAHDLAQLLEYAKCMRSHGIPNFPDPSSRPDGGWGFKINGPALGQNSPTYQAADHACKRLEP